MDTMAPFAALAIAGMSFRGVGDWAEATQATATIAETSFIALSKAQTARPDT
jgi:hypothetical protein